MKRIIYILIIGMWPLLSVAQEDDFDFFYYDQAKDKYYDKELAIKTFDDKKWETAKGDIDYTPAAIKEKKKKEREQQANNNNNSNNTPNRPRRNRDYSGWDWDVGDGTMSGLFKGLLIILLVGLIAFLVFRLAGGSFEIKEKSDRGPTGSITKAADITRVEQNLHKSDMEILIDKTLEEKNYMMVTRLYYLWAIKELSAKRLIKWKRDKTNRDYLRELHKTDLHKPFRKVTRIFEEIWYGNRTTLDKEKFNAIESQLKGFVEQVKRK